MCCTAHPAEPELDLVKSFTKGLNLNAVCRHIDSAVSRTNFADSSHCIGSALRGWHRCNVDLSLSLSPPPPVHTYTLTSAENPKQSSFSFLQLDQASGKALRAFRTFWSGYKAGHTPRRPAIQLRGVPQRSTSPYTWIFQSFLCYSHQLDRAGTN
jgi:hypothetical protein